MALTYGTTGVLAKDYQIYLELQTAADAGSLYANYIAAHTHETAELLIAGLGHLGECRKDSIDVEIAGGDTVMGNEVGEIEINKQGSFTVELLNSTVANITYLQNTLGGKSCCVVLKEKDDHGASMRQIIVIPNCTVKIAEKHTGGGISLVTITMTKSVPTADDFRDISEVSYA